MSWEGKHEWEIPYRQEFGNVGPARDKESKGVVVVLEKGNGYGRSPNLRRGCGGWISVRGDQPPHAYYIVHRVYVDPQIHQKLDRLLAPMRTGHV